MCISITVDSETERRSLTHFVPFVSLQLWQHQAQFINFFLHKFALFLDSGGPQRLSPPGGFDSSKTYTLSTKIAGRDTKIVYHPIPYKSLSEEIVRSLKVDLSLLSDYEEAFDSPIEVNKDGKVEVFYMWVALRRLALIFAMKSYAQITPKLRLLLKVFRVDPCATRNVRES